MYSQFTNLPTPQIAAAICIVLFTVVAYCNKLYEARHSTDEEQATEEQHTEEQRTAGHHSDDQHSEEQHTEEQRSEDQHTELQHSKKHYTEDKRRGDKLTEDQYAKDQYSEDNTEYQYTEDQYSEDQYSDSEHSKESNDCDHTSEGTETSANRVSPSSPDSHLRVAHKGTSSSRSHSTTNALEYVHPLSPCPRFGRL